jgi:hypothetical protein
VCSPPKLIVRAGSPELNGCRGVVRSFVEEKGRYKVALRGRAKKPVGLKPSNVRVVL